MPQTPINHAANAALVELATHVLPVWIRHLATSRTHSEEAVSEMISAFSNIGPYLSSGTPAKDKDLKPVGELVEQMYVGFQYEDRINQMLSLLLEDMQRMLTIVSTPALQISDELNHTTWLERLESKYAMAEQRQVHVGDASSHHSANATANDADGNTDFF